MSTTAIEDSNLILSISKVNLNGVGVLPVSDEFPLVNMKADSLLTPQNFSEFVWQVR